MPNENNLKPPLYPENIPSPLKQRPNWVCWTEEIKNGKQTKPPVDVRTGEKAKSDDANTWTTYDNALEYYQEHSNNGIRGIGFELGPRQSTVYVGIDLDHCRNPETGEIAAWAQKIIDKLASYTEISPSGEGIRIWVIAVLPENGRKKGHVEMYDGNRYLTVTGNHLPGTPLTIECRHDEIEELHKEVFGENKVQEEQPQTETINPTLQIEDNELLQRIFNADNGAKVKKLFEGDCSGYPSRSEAHMALCCHLAFWTGKDHVKMDALFRQSKLFSEYANKWDKKHFSNGLTYGQATIKKAIETTSEVYEPKEKKEEPTESKKPKATLVMEHFEEFPSSWFTNFEVREATGLSADDVRDILRRKRDAGLLITDGKRHRLTPPSRIVDPFEIMAGAFELEFPLSLHEYAIISQGDVAVVSGWKNCGKTGFLMETALLNSKRGLDVNYCVTENVAKIGRRYLQWGYTPEEIRERITFRDCRDRDYINIIKRDCLNVLDYYNPPNGEYHRTAADIEDMAKSLGKGVLIIGIQHARDAKMPRGGELSQELSQMSVVLSEVETINTGGIDERKVGKARILTIKEPGVRKGGEGRVCQYEVTEKGGRLVQVGDWDYPRKDKK